MEKTAEFSKRDARLAPLTNVHLCARALERTINRSANLPGFVGFTGPSGWGKSMAASYCCTRYGAVYVECRSTLTRRSFVASILREMGVSAERTIPEMMEQVAEHLDLSQRPLIVDESDYLIDRNVIEMLRDLHEMSHSTILLIGEEQFPRKLLKWERFHNRVLVWQLAQPCNLDDARKLAAFYCPNLEVADDLLERVKEMARGGARRICVNLDMIRDYCQKQGLKRINLEGWGRREIYTGDVPARSRA